jgi:hypothetical protein
MAMESQFIFRPSYALFFATVRIEAQTPEGPSVGTGFYFSYGSEQEGNLLNVVLTNKHIVAGANTGTILTRVGTEVPNAHQRSVEVELDNFSAKWIGHDEGDIDLCALPVSDIEEELQAHNIELSGLCIPMSYLATADDLASLLPIEEVFMAGYPIGLYDTYYGTTHTMDCPSCVKASPPATRVMITVTSLRD